MKVTIEAEMCKKDASPYSHNEYDVLYKVHIEGKSTEEVETKMAEVQKAATHLGLVIR